MIQSDIISSGTFFSIRTDTLEDNTKVVWLYYLDIPLKQLTDIEYTELQLHLTSTEYPGTN